MYRGASIDQSLPPQQHMYIILVHLTSENLDTGYPDISWARVVVDQMCHLVLSELNMTRWCGWSEESQTDTLGLWEDHVVLSAMCSWVRKSRRRS